MKALQAAIEKKKSEMEERHAAALKNAEKQLVSVGNGPRDNNGLLLAHPSKTNYRVSLGKSFQIDQHHVFFLRP